MASGISRKLDGFATFVLFVTCVVEFASSNWFSGLGWLCAGCGWLAFDAEQDFFESLKETYRMSLEECEGRIRKLMSDLAKKDGEEQPKSSLDSSIINMENMDIDHILKVGRDFQNTDKWHGAQYDTAKLLCDTIEHLRKRGTRNCDVYRTVDEALDACYSDRGYCPSVEDERKSVISFMLQDEKDNAFKKSGEGEDEKDNG